MNSGGLFGWGVGVFHHCFLGKVWDQYYQTSSWEISQGLVQQQVHYSESFGCCSQTNADEKVYLTPTQKFTSFHNQSVPPCDFGANYVYKTYTAPFNVSFGFDIIRSPPNRAGYPWSKSYLGLHLLIHFVHYLL